VTKPVSGALDFLDTLVGRAADVAVARANGDVATGRVTDQTRVPHTSPLQVGGVPIGAYLPWIIGGAVIAVAAFLVLRRRR